MSGLEPKVRAMVTEFIDVFPEDLPPELPPARAAWHTTPTEPGAQPPSCGARRHSPAEVDEIKQQLSKLLATRRIEPNTSPYNAPALFNQKKDGSLRMCVDYRRLNAITKKNKYPLPRIDDLIDQLRGSKFYSSLDLQSGYHQIRVADEDVEKTAFRTPFGLYQFKVLSFGLTNAPATFQRVINEVFRDYINAGFGVIYLDDVLIHSKTEQEHERHVRMVLERLRGHKLYTKLSKCDFFRREVKFHWPCRWR